MSIFRKLLNAQGGYAKVKSFKDTMDVFGDKNQYVADQVPAAALAPACGTLERARVQEAAVYAVPDERLGEEVGATVYGEPSLDPEQIRQFLGTHLARFEVPRYIRIADAPLPRTASGKILKRQIRDEAVAGMTSDHSTGRPAA